MLGFSLFISYMVLSALVVGIVLIFEGIVLNLRQKCSELEKDEQDSKKEQDDERTDK